MVAPGYKSRGGKGSRKAGGGGGGGGSSAATEAEAPKAQEPQSVFNALGKELSYGGETQDTSNSRLFGARKQVQNLSGFKSLDADSQAGMIDSIVIQLKERSGGALTERASKDLQTLWKNSKQEARDILARQGLGDIKASNPTVKRLVKSSQLRQKEFDRQAAKKRSATKRKPDNAMDDLFAGL